MPLFIINKMLKGVLYYKMENATVALGPTIRQWGQALFKQGMGMQGASAHEDSLVPSLRCVPVSESKYPRLLDVPYLIN
jgi:hypothetical protein